MRHRAHLQLNIYHVGWLSAELDDLSNLYPVKPLVNSARRFERANFNLIGLYGLIESVKTIQEIGKEEIEKIILSRTEQFMNKLEQINCEILTPRENRNRAGIVSFRIMNGNSKRVYEKLGEENIVCSFREGWIRIAVHFLNADAELEKVLKVIQLEAS